MRANRQNPRGRSDDSNKKDTRNRGPFRGGNLYRKKKGKKKLGRQSFGLKAPRLQRREGSRASSAASPSFHPSNRPSSEKRPPLSLFRLLYLLLRSPKQIHSKANIGFFRFSFAMVLYCPALSSRFYPIRNRSDSSGIAFPREIPRRLAFPTRLAI